MHIASALRRKRDEITAIIAAYEARLEAARMDLAVIELAGRLFDPEAEPGPATIPLAMKPVALPLARARRVDDQDASLCKSIGDWERRFLGKAPSPDMQEAAGEIPDEFLYLNWP